jgi:hypothetical protein
MRTQIGLWYCFERKESKLMCRELKKRHNQLDFQCNVKAVFRKTRIFCHKIGQRAVLNDIQRVVWLYLQP